MTRLRSAGRVSANWLIIIAAFAAAAGLWLGMRVLAPARGPDLASAVMYPAPRALPAFELDRSDGGKLTLEDWKGRWTVVFFGYTNCPDVCPTTLADFKQAWKRLPAATKERVRFDFISVDPERDTPAQLARYVGFFDPQFVAASGSDEQLTRITRALGLVYARGEPKDGTYEVDHSASAVLIDPDGHQAGVLRPPFEAAKIAADLVTLAGAR
ncbi:MAG: SCO family protein [Dokdonella sp.]|uniref:SCO family protein n=1 Tax=Dokdonella sp. TaxID=2291710 RepID=UPI003F7E07EC